MHVIFLFSILLLSEAYAVGPSLLLHKTNPRMKVRALTYKDLDNGKIEVTNCDGVTTQQIEKNDYIFKDYHNVCNEWQLSFEIMEGIKNIPPSETYSIICYMSPKEKLENVTEFKGVPLLQMSGNNKKITIITSSNVDRQYKAYAPDGKFLDTYQKLSERQFSNMEELQKLCTDSLNKFEKAKDSKID